jgi:glycosyltransferase involved in cell wall biosynthesis
VRIACVNQDPGVAPGRRKGAAVHLSSLRRAFGQSGAEVLALDGGAREIEQALARAHAQQPLDLVYERHALGATSAARFSRRTGVPLFLEVNAPLVDEARLHRGFAPARADFEAESFVLQSAAALFPVSRAVAHYLEDRGVARPRIHVTANGVDLDVFKPRAERPSALGLARDAFALGFHGRLRPWHNFELLVAAFAALCARGYAVELVCVGEGEFLAYVPRELRARVHVTGWLDAEALGAHVAAFHVLPLTYAADAPCYFSPLKLLEAMACGVVPIVPELGDLPAAVGHGRAGVVVRPGDARALADAIAGLIEWPDVRERLAREAQRVAGRRSWVTVAREILAVAAGVAAR